MQKQLILTDYEVNEYETLHKSFAYYRDRCNRLEEQIEKYKERETPMKKIYRNGLRRCPKCDYTVDYMVPPQRYCDRCGQRLIESGAKYERF